MTQTEAKTIKIGTTLVYRRKPTDAGKKIVVTAFNARRQFFEAEGFPDGAWPRNKCETK